MKRLVGIAGKAGVGKSTAASVAADLGYVTVAFADPMKRFLHREVGFPEPLLWGASESRETHHPTKGFSARHGLRLIGEAGRTLDPDLWLDIALRVANDILDHGSGYSGPLGLQSPHGPRLLSGGVVIPDVRFRREYQAIRRRGGTLIRIRRDGAGLRGEAGRHASETDLESLPDSAFDAVIQNNATIDELAAAVRRALGVYHD